MTMPGAPKYKEKNHEERSRGFRSDNFAGPDKAAASQRQAKNAPKLAPGES